MSQTPNEHSQQRWHPFTRTAFRFAFVYLLLYNLPFPLNIFPYVDKVGSFYDSLWTWLVPRLARAAFNQEVSTVVNGSGDRTYDFLLVACLLLIALVITVIWTFFDRKRLSYPTLYRWLNLYVRFALATTMIGYSAFKVISSQFPPPTLERLVQSYGDSSPMGLLWTFMGASEAYTRFVGFAEMISGVLLFSRKTSTLGALMSIGVLSNVVALNFSYDVPVKLYSSHLLAEAIFLVLPDARRLGSAARWCLRVSSRLLSLVYLCINPTISAGASLVRVRRCMGSGRLRNLAWDRRHQQRLLSIGGG